MLFIFYLWKKINGYNCHTFPAFLLCRAPYQQCILSHNISFWWKHHHIMKKPLFFRWVTGKKHQSKRKPSSESLFAKALLWQWPANVLTSFVNDITFCKKKLICFASVLLKLFRYNWDYSTKRKIDSLWSYPFYCKRNWVPFSLKRIFRI